MKVKIKQSSSPWYWYHDKIGKIFEVIPSKGIRCHVPGTIKCIDKQDFVRI